MTTDTPSIDCQVICDLMVVYASGEASPETIAYIEAHLDDCPECREAYEAAQRGEEMLGELAPVARPIHIDGRKILVRVQRLVFGAASILLLLTVLALALAERWILRDLLGLPLAQLYVLPGGWEWSAGALALAVLYGLLYTWRVRNEDEADRPYMALIGGALAFGLGVSAYSFMARADVVGVLTAGTLTFALYIFILRYRARQHTGRFFGELLLSLEATVPLLFLVLAALNLVNSGSFPAAALSVGLVVFALFFTLLRLDELPYMTVLTLVALFAGGLMLIGNAVGGVAGIFDLQLDWPSELGHPADPPSDLAAFNLDQFGYRLVDSGPAAGPIGRETLPADAAGTAFLYENAAGNEIVVYVLDFNTETPAENFFGDWFRGVDGGFYAVHLDLNETLFNEPDGRGDHPLRWELELPGAWFGQAGQVARSYGESGMTAVSAWQFEEYVTIIEVDGIATRALPLAKEVKEIVAEAYGP